MRTYTYKAVGECRIQADVYADSSVATSRPVIVWLHGGALIMGHRGGISQADVGRYIAAGYIVVAIDYRLAPESKLPQIVEDVQDAHRWVCGSGPGLFGADPGRIAVVGESAGGYLALMSGFHLNPRPRALVSFYGYGDITGAWYSSPNPFYRRTQRLVAADEARAVVGPQPIANGEAQPNRWRFYVYCRQNGLWPREVVGHDPTDEPHAFDPYCPVRNVTPDYPPTLLLHGDQDTDVPYEQSVLMAAALARVGVAHELITLPGAGHGFNRGTGTNDQAVAGAYAHVLRFLADHL